MSINYGYLFTYGEDGKKLPSKRDLKRAIDGSIYEGEGERDLKIKVSDETLHLVIETSGGGNCIMEVFLTKDDGIKSEIYLSRFLPKHYFVSFRQKLIAEAFYDSAKLLIKNPTLDNKEKIENIKNLFVFAFSGSD